MSFDVAKWNKQRYFEEARITKGPLIEDQHLDIVIEYLRDADGDDAANYLEQMRSFITNSMSKVTPMASEGYLSQKALDAAYNRPQAKPLDFTDKADKEILDDFIKLVDDQDYWTSVMADFSNPEYDAKAEVIRTYRNELANRGLGDTAEKIEDTARKMYLF